MAAHHKGTVHQVSTEKNAFIKSDFWMLFLLLCCYWMAELVSI